MFEELDMINEEFVNKILDNHNRFDSIIKKKMEKIKKIEHVNPVNYVADHSANKKQLDEMQKDLDELLK